jgi:hypothetical protein
MIICDRWLSKMGGLQCGRVRSSYKMGSQRSLRCADRLQTMKGIYRATNRKRKFIGRDGRIWRLICQRCSYKLTSPPELSCDG